MNTLSWSKWWLMILVTTCCGLLRAQNPPADFSLNLTRVHRSPLEPDMVFAQHYSWTNGPIGGNGLLLPGTEASSSTTGEHYLVAEWWGTYLITPATRTVESIESGERPIGAAYDSRRRVFWIATLSGEGFLYTYEPLRKMTTQVRSLNHYDLDSMLYHAPSDTLFAMTSYGNLVQFSMDGHILKDFNVVSLPTGFYVHGYKSAIIQVGDKLAVLAEANRVIGDTEVKESRIYRVDPATKTSQLTYRKVWNRWPINTPPLVRIVSPSPTNFSAGVTLSLNALASDYEVGIKGVTFKVNGQELQANQSSTDRFAFAVDHLFSLPGQYRIEAFTSDWDGGTNSAQPVIIDIFGNVPPTVAITQPQTGAQYKVGDTLYVEAAGNDPGGGIIKVEFLNNMLPFGIGTETNTLDGTNQRFFLRKKLEVPGVYRLTARATDTQGTIGNSTNVVHVLVQPDTNNIPPSVQIISPANDAIFNEESTVRLVAIANDQNGHVTNVVFLANQNHLGNGRLTTNSAGNNVYELNWRVVTPGTYILQARATDNHGAMTWSSPVTIKVYESGHPSIAFSLDFIPYFRTIPTSSQVFSRHYTESGETDRGRLLPGVRAVKLGNDWYATESHSLLRINGTTGRTTELAPTGINIPQLSWPTGVTVDSRRNRLLLASLGGDGFLYSYNPALGTWEVLENFHGADYDSIAYHPANDKLYVTGVTSPGVHGKVFQLDADGDVEKMFELPTLGKGVGLGGALRSEVVALDQDFVVVLLESNYPSDPMLAGAESRMFIIDLRTDEVTEVYNKVWEAEPVRVELLTPLPGNQVIVGEPVNLTARVHGAREPIRVVFTAGGTNVAPGIRVPLHTNLWLGTWRPSTPGTYQLLAKIVDGFGRTNVSTPIDLLVKPLVEKTAPVAAILEPMPESVFRNGGKINVQIEANDADGTVTQVELFSGETRLGNAYPIRQSVLYNSITLDPIDPTLGIPPIRPRPLTNRWEFIWNNPPVGTHLLRARATDNDGLVGTSAPVRIQVLQTNSAAFSVTRLMPANYQPGVAVQVNLAVSGAAESGAYAVEDHPPAGWMVSRIGHEGFYDAATGKVKFGPYTDNLDRMLSYIVVPPAGASNLVEFAGRASARGHEHPILGAIRMTSTPARHPADMDPADNRISINELTAYAAAWKAARGWNHSTNPIPVSYVTRAGHIWRNGEAYQLKPGIAPPLCWEPISPVISPREIQGLSFQPQSTTTRHLQFSVDQVSVRIFVEPKPGTSSYALEETLPEGWRVVSIPHEVTVSEGTLRWGPFYDDLPRELTYSIAPAHPIDHAAYLAGTFSLDGQDQLVTGRAILAEAPLRLELGRNFGGARLKLSAPATQPWMIEAAHSLDAKTWSEVGLIPPGQVEAELPLKASGQGFYRLRQN